MKLITALTIICFISVTLFSGCASKTDTVEISPSEQLATSKDLKPTIVPDKLSATVTPTRGLIGPTLVIKTLEGTSIPPVVFTQVTPEATATPEPTVQEDYFPNALIQVIEPGSKSQLASPFTVQASVFPGDGNLVSLQLVGEDGRLIYDQLKKLATAESGWSNLIEEIKFEIPSAGESAMLVLTTRDEFDRRITQSAVELFLMQIGKSDINHNPFLKQPFILQSPKSEAEIKGGVVHVVGYVHADNSNPIILELLTESGGVMETEIVKLPRGADKLNYVPFSADILYDIGIPTPVRLTIRQRSLVLPNIDIALASWLITLYP